MASLVGGVRGGKVLLFEGHRYHKNKTGTESIWWRCWRPHCRATLQTNIFPQEEDNPNIQVDHVGEHEHAEEGDMIMKNYQGYLIFSIKGSS